MMAVLEKRHSNRSAISEQIGEMSFGNNNDKKQIFILLHTVNDNVILFKTVILFGCYYYIL